MMLVDGRVGSREFADWLKARDIPVRLARLPSGDFQFAGNGPGGLGKILVERKTVMDLIGSLDSGRAQKQVAEMAVSGSLSNYLILEGYHRYNEEKLLCLPRRGSGMVPHYNGKRSYSMSYIEGWLNSAAVEAGIKIAKTNNRQETCFLLETLYWWWRKPWDRHTGVGDIATLGKDMGRFNGLSALARVKLGVVEQTAALLPGIGPTRAILVGERFKTVREMCEADAAAWRTIDGIGKATAEKAVETLNTLGLKRS